MILFIVVIINKWEAILNRVNSIKDNNPSEKELLNFNNDPIPFVNGIIDAKSDSTISIVFLGNSITLCTMPDEIQDKTKRGLTATSLDKDYVHHLINTISDQYNVNVEFAIANIAEFERMFGIRDFPLNEKFRDNKVLDPDWLIVQIGENVSEKDLLVDKEYREKFANLLNYFPNAKKIITIPFWPSKTKQLITTQIALDNNCYLVDLSHLGNGTDTDNFASSQRKYANSGVGMHPGDTGMENIANVIFTIINANHRERTQDPK